MSEHYTDEQVFNLVGCTFMFTVLLCLMLGVFCFKPIVDGNWKIEAVKGGHARYNSINAAFEWKEPCNEVERTSK